MMNKLNGNINGSGNFGHGCLNPSITEMDERQLMLRLERLAHLEGLRENRDKAKIPSSIQTTIDSKAYESEVIKRDGSTMLEGPFTFKELSSQPENPEDGCAVMWLSDGTGSGGKGDIMIKISIDGISKTIVLVDFSEI